MTSIDLHYPNFDGGLHERKSHRTEVSNGS